MANLEQSLARLGEVQDQNAKTLFDCAYVLEAQQWMIMRIIEDVAAQGRNGVHTLPDGKLNWPHYEAQYKSFVEAEVQKQAAAKEAAEAPEDPDAGAVIFGG